MSPFTVPGNSENLHSRNTAFKLQSNPPRIYTCLHVNVKQDPNFSSPCCCKHTFTFECMTNTLTGSDRLNIPDPGKQQWEGQRLAQAGKQRKQTGQWPFKRRTRNPWFNLYSAQMVLCTMPAPWLCFSVCAIPACILHPATVC